MLRLLAFAAVALLSAGCGYVGEPLPPALHIPQRVSDLSAVERGDQIEAAFTLPTHTTEGLLISRPITFEMRVGPPPEPFRVDTWASGARPFEGAPSDQPTVHYPVPAAEWSGKVVVIAVKVLGANGRDDGWSNLVTLSVVPPLVPPASLQAQGVAEGVRLAWQGSAQRYRVYRRADDESKSDPLAETVETEFTDKAAAYDQTYHYSVEALQTEGDVRAMSEMSAEVEITPKDTFPPAVPTGLAVLASTGSIELVWNRDTEPDLAGYRVYRALGAGPFEKLAETQEAPAYSDRKIEPGKTYRYAVSAFDKAGNESDKSASVEVTTQ